MATLIIAYDLNNEVRRPPIVEKIKQTFNSWALLSESSYAVRTDITPQQVYQILQPLLDADDGLYVITLTRPWWGQGSKEVVEWLRSGL